MGAPPAASCGPSEKPWQHWLSFEARATPPWQQGTNGSRVLDWLELDEDELLSPLEDELEETLLQLLSELELPLLL